MQKYVIDNVFLLLISESQIFESLGFFHDGILQFSKHTPPKNNFGCGATENPFSTYKNSPPAAAGGPPSTIGCLVRGV